MSDTAVGQIILFFTTLAGFGIQIYRENRKRKWDMEDRAAIAAALARHTEEVAAKLDQTVKVHHKEQLDAIASNTDVSVKAFIEANDVNRKIAGIAAAVRRTDDPVRAVLADAMESLICDQKDQMKG